MRTKLSIIRHIYSCIYHADTNDNMSVLMTKQKVVSVRILAAL